MFWGILEDKNLEEKSILHKHSPNNTLFSLVQLCLAVFVDHLDHIHTRSSHHSDWTIIIIVIVCPIFPHSTLHTESWYLLCAGLGFSLWKLICLAPHVMKCSPFIVSQIIFCTAWYMVQNSNINYCSTVYSRCWVAASDFVPHEPIVVMENSSKLQL